MIIFLNYASLAVMFACCCIISTQSASRMQRLAFLQSVVVTICSIGFIYPVEARDVRTYLAGQKICYGFVTHAMFLFLLFVLEYCRYEMPKFVQWIFHGINFVITFIVLSLDHHKLFYISCQGFMENGQFITKKEYGFVHTVEIVMITLYVFAFIIVALVFTIKNIRTRRNYVWPLIGTFLIPCMAYFLPKLTGSINDVQNIAFAVFLILLMYMIYRNNLYDVENIAARLSIESMEEGFIVFDNRDCFMGCNKKAEELFPEIKQIELDSNIRKFDNPFVDYIDGKSDEYRVDDVIYSVSVRSISDGNITQGKVIRLEDVTAQRNYTDLLKEKQEQIESDLEMAQTIQLSVLPNARHVFSSVPQLNTAAFMETAKEVGGDFYDLYMVGENKAVFLIADVSGKGIPAAMFMMQAKSTIRNLVEEGLPVNEVFTRANAKLCQGNDARMFVTAWMCMVDLSTGLMQLVNAGHNAPVFISSDGQCQFLKKKSGMVLAGMPGIRYTIHELQLNHGDRLYLYTDGVTEATDINEELYGNDRLLDFFRKHMKLSVEDTIPAIKSDIDAFVGEAEQFDDITMVMFEYV